MRDPVIYAPASRYRRPRLGKHQLAMLRKVGTTAALVVPDKTSRRLVELGLMAAEPDGSFASITPEGLRAGRCRRRGTDQPVHDAAEAQGGDR